MMEHNRDTDNRYDPEPPDDRDKCESSDSLGGSYYYDDATGYETYEPGDDDEESEED